MKSFITSLPSIVRLCRAAQGLMLLFDFDGTLAPIALHPGAARMPDEWRCRLRILARLPGVTVGIVTGRSLADIRSRIGISNIILAASHGYEIVRGRTRLLDLGHEHHRPLKKLAAALAVGTGDIDGVVIEYKRTSVAVHYRLVDRNRRAKLLARVRSIAREAAAAHGWQLTGGKMVIEARPALAWNKGDAARWIWKHLAPDTLPCYIGDDTTDEDAFRALDPQGITIRVGARKQTHARYGVRAIDELIPWFESMVPYR